jgi:hypothetical protein
MRQMWSDISPDTLAAYLRARDEGDSFGVALIETRLHHSSLVGRYRNGQMQWFRKQTWVPSRDKPIRELNRRGDAILEIGELRYSGAYRPLPFLMRRRAWLSPR